MEPSADACAQTVYAWAAAVWEELTSRPRLQQAWMKAAVAKMAGELSWRSVVGPAAAVALIAEELDWKWVSATTWKASEGIVLDAAVVCPRDIKEMAKRDHVRKQWRQWTARAGYQHLAPAPLFKSIQRWYKDNMGGDRNVGHSTTAKAVEKGLMAQADYAAAAGTLEVDCRACQGCLGTVGHRLYRCMGHRLQRNATSPGPHQMGASADSERATMLWTRALTQDPAARYSFRPDEETLEWHGHGDRALEGTITVDGSCIGGAAELGATGWAAVQAAADDEESAAGTSARRGEYIAISGTVPNALPV